MRRVVWVVAGGTAGHIHAALSVIEAFDQDTTPILITTDRPIDHEITEDLAYQVVRIQGVGLARTVFGVLKSLTANVRALASNVRTLRALDRPSMVISFGGFHTPLVSAVARTLGARSFVLEQNAALGRSNRIVGVWSSRIFLAWPVPLPKSWVRRSVVVGNPPRRQLLELEDRSQLRASLGVGVDEILVVATSGSLGALSINRAMSQAAAELVAQPQIRIIHSMGSKNVVDDRVANERYVRLGYAKDLYRYVMAADLVVARAGASTLTEIAMSGVPSILIPLPHAPHDHQRLNAEVFERAGAAVIVADDDVSGERLTQLIRELASDTPRRVRMGMAARRLAHPQAARFIVREMAEL